MKTIEENGIRYTVVLEEETIAIEGNVQASGDDEDDRRVEQWVRDQLKAGNLGAWCTVKVTAEITIGEDTFSGVDYLGAVSYASEAECEAAMLGPDYDMKAQALDSLCRNLEAYAKRRSVARKALLKIKGGTKP